MSPRVGSAEEPKESKQIKRQHTLLAKRLSKTTGLNWTLEEGPDVFSLPGNNMYLLIGEPNVKGIVGEVDEANLKKACRYLNEFCKPVLEEWATKVNKVKSPHRFEDQKPKFDYIPDGTIEINADAILYIATKYGEKFWNGLTAMSAKDLTPLFRPKGRKK